MLSAAFPFDTFHYFAWFNRGKFLPRLQSHCVSRLGSKRIATMVGCP